MNRADLAVFLVDVLDLYLYPRQAPFAATARVPVIDRRVH